MKNILVPCDFSPTAVNAFKFAAGLARKSKGEITLLHVVELPVLRHGPVPITALEKVYLKGVKARVAKDFEKLCSTWGKGLQVHLVIDHGAVNHTVIKNIKKRKIGLVVMGSHGASGAREMLLGSNAEKIVRFSPVPVITVKKSVNPTIKNIVFATSLSAVPAKVIEKLKDLQNLFKANLNIVYVNTPTNFRPEVTLRPMIADFMKQNRFTKNCTFTTYVDQSVEEGVKNFSKKVKADMVAMDTDSKKGLLHFIFGSIAEDVANHIECPIWTCTTDV